MSVSVKLNNITARRKTILKEDILFNEANCDDKRRSFFTGKGQSVEAVYELSEVNVLLDFNASKYSKEEINKEIFNAIQLGVVKYGDKFIFDEVFAKKTLTKLLRTKLSVKHCLSISWKGETYYEGQILIRIAQDMSTTLRLRSEESWGICLPIYEIGV